MPDNPYIPLVIIALGVLALVLPYRFNPFRLKSTWASSFSEGTNRAIPKVIGGIFVVIGVLSLLIVGLDHFSR